jgi:Fuc2NAc and GlcNAc transferase
MGVMDRNLLLMLPAAFAAVFWLTNRMRRYALDRSLLDVPNLRSSHAVATPRGGGVAIAVVVLAAVPILAWNNALAWSDVWALCGGGMAVALIGFMDDHRHVSAPLRLLGHFAVAGWTLYWLGGPPPFQILGSSIELAWTGHVTAALYLVWILNLTNFMDGIDGLAGMQAVTVCSGGALLYLIAGAGWKSALMPLILVAATAGFLCWNWPPAKIFMGDAGSGFIGFMFGVLALRAGWADPVLFWGWTILLGVFVVDATLTLLRRVLTGETFYEAHRSHGYQHAAQRYRAHGPVTVFVGFINVVWLLPIAAAVASDRLDGAIGILLAYLPLLVLAAHFGAGTRAGRRVL